VPTIFLNLFPSVSSFLRVSKGSIKPAESRGEDVSHFLEADFGTTGEDTLWRGSLSKGVNDSHAKPHAAMTARLWLGRELALESSRRYRRLSTHANGDLIN